MWQVAIREHMKCIYIYIIYNLLKDNLLSAYDYL